MDLKNENCGNLILTRKAGQRLYIGDDIVITIHGIHDYQVKIGIIAPKELAILREEVMLRNLIKENPA